MEYKSVVLFGGNYAYEKGKRFIDKEVDTAFEAHSVADIANHYGDGWQVVPQFHLHIKAPNCLPDCYSDEYLLVRATT